MALLAMTLVIGGYRLSNGLHILRARSLLSGRRMELMKFSRALEDFDRVGGRVSPPLSHSTHRAVPQWALH